MIKGNWTNSQYTSGSMPKPLPPAPLPSPPHTQTPNPSLKEININYINIYIYIYYIKTKSQNLFEKSITISLLISHCAAHTSKWFASCNISSFYSASAILQHQLLQRQSQRSSHTQILWQLFLVNILKSISKKIILVLLMF